MSQTVIGVLRRFLPEFLRKGRDQKTPQAPAVQRAIWAIRHCRTATMGGHLYTCPDCRERAFAWHSCNHRSCPQCGRSATREWVARELAKRIGAPYFMVTFTLPRELRGLFFGRQAKAAYDLFFTAAATALREKLADPKWLGARNSGFTAILHTWNQRLHFHPHLHCIVPGAGVSAEGKVITVKNANFLVPVKVLQGAFRWHFRQLLEKQDWQVDPVVWTKDWGVHLQPFGDGESAIKYLGAYVCKTAIGDSRIIASDRKSVSFRWKDRSDGDRSKVEMISGCEFVARYLRHVLPKAMRAIRYYGYCHPAHLRPELPTNHPWPATPRAIIMTMRSTSPQMEAASAFPRTGWCEPCPKSSRGDDPATCGPKSRSSHGSPGELKGPGKPPVRRSRPATAAALILAQTQNASG